MSDFEASRAAGLTSVARRCGKRANVVLLRRSAGALGLILSTVGMVCCAGGVIGIWVFRQDASERLPKAFARLDVGLQRASAANGNLQRAVGKARTDVAEVGKGSGDLGQGGGKGRRASRTLKTLIQKVGPDVEDLGGRLATLSDVAVTVSSLLETFQELLPGRIGHLEPGQLERWEEEARKLSTSLRRLEAVVGEGEKETGGQQVAAATNEVDLVLQRCQTQANAWQADLDAAREKMRQVRAQVAGWLTPTAVAVTVLLVWVAVGQISLFAHALQWFRGRSGGAPDAPGTQLGRLP